MSLRASYISWILVVLLSIVTVYEVIGSNRAEQRAAQAEAVAKDTDAKLQQFVSQSEIREKQAEVRYEASMAESANLRAILAKGSQARPQNAPQSSQEPIRRALDASKQLPPNQPAPSAQSPCSEFIYQGSPLVIEGFQVLVCDQKPVVQAEAAVAYHEQLALVAKLNTELAEATAKLALEDKDLAQYKVAEQQWKKAAKKSRIKRVLGVAEKVGLFAAGVYLGRIAH